MRLSSTLCNDLRSATALGDRGPLATVSRGSVVIPIAIEWPMYAAGIGLLSRRRPLTARKSVVLESFGIEAGRAAMTLDQRREVIASLDDMYLTSDPEEQSAEAWAFKSATFDSVNRKVRHNPAEGGGGHTPAG